MQPHPSPELAERARQIEKSCPYLAALPIARSVFEIDPIGRCVLRNNQKFLHSRGHQALGFAQHVSRGPRNKVAPQLGDDAEAAAIVTALGNLQIGIVSRCELDALRWQEIEKR